MHVGLCQSLVAHQASAYCTCFSSFYNMNLDKEYFCFPLDGM